jgi:rare lipoprotein A
VTNLETGRQILVRVNDRGPASPGRVIGLSPRAGVLLATPVSGAASGPASGVLRVRVRIDEAMSRAVVDQLGGGPKLAIAAAPATSITAEALPPPGGGAAGITVAGGMVAGPVRTIGGSRAEARVAVVADRMPERISMTYPHPGALYLLGGSFGRFTYANVVAARLSGLGARVVQSRDGRQSVFSVQAGPFAAVVQADAALAEALRAGVVDARIGVQ